MSKVKGWYQAARRSLARKPALVAGMAGALVYAALTHVPAAAAFILATTTANMSLDLPDVGVTTGPEYADKIVQAFTDLDAHDHTSGKGVSVPVSGLNINATLDMKPSATEYGVGEAKYYQCEEQSASPAIANSIWSDTAGDLYWRDDGGNDVQITDGASLNASAIGGFAGDYVATTATATYSDANKAYSFLQDTGKTADVIGGRVGVAEKGVASSKIVYWTAPASLAGDYSLTLFDALPNADARVQVDSSGNMSFVGNYPMVTIGDGTTSAGEYEGTDETPFSSAITALSSGGIIYVGPGTYTFSSNLTITQDDITIIGAGRDITHIQGGINGAVLTINADNVHVEGVHIKQTDTSNNNTSAVVFESSATNSSVRNSHLEHANNGASGNPRRAVWILASNNRLTGNQISAYTAGTTINTYVVQIGDPSEAATASYDNNVISENHVTVTDNSSTTAGGAVFSIVADATNGSSTTVTARRNVINGNVVDDSGDIRAQVYLASATDTAGQTASVVGNVISANVFADAGRLENALITEDDAGGGTATTKRNLVAGNVFPNPPSGDGWTHTGVNDYDNTFWGPSEGGYAWCDDTSCATGTRAIDRHFNVEVD